MKTLYLDCQMGAAGDMLTAALLELMPDPEAALKQLNQLNIPKVTYEAERVEKCGIVGTHMRVLVEGNEEESLDHHAHEHHHEHGNGDHHEHSHEHDHSHEHGHTHHHSSLQDIGHIVEALPVSDKVKKDVMAVYQIIAEAESQVHGKEITEIHFHEVGTMDAVADVSAVCLLMEALQPDQVIASPIHVGSGQVHCAHGILPVPAPATALILQGIPSYGGEIRGELCTPTGAALLKYFADSYGAQPVMRVEKIGYGCGKKNFSQANLLRASLGETEKKEAPIIELSCNLDDMTAEDIGFAMDALFTAGALDVYTIPIGMKKNRPGTLLSVLCREAQREEMVGLLFRHTTTIGIREQSLRRHTLDRSIEEVETSFGPMHRKRVSGYGIERSKWEYEDLKRAAEETGCSLEEIRKALS